MEELIKLDKNFNKDMFISKVNNIFVMLHMAVMTDDLDRVRHYISNEVELKYEKILAEYNKKQIKKIYDELNVKSTEITNVSMLEGIIQVQVKIKSRYLEYIVDKSTNNFISGNKNFRIEKTHYLTLSKKINEVNNKIVTKCPNCGASLDINKTGKCDYCKTILDIEKYDWILTSIETQL